MNHNPPIASNWRGRVLLAIWHEECEKPKIEHKRIVEPPGIEHFVRDNYEEVRQWELRA